MADPSKRTPAVMFQGTGSDVGKSLLVAGLCRVFARRGIKVRPFKPQNMSNNAAVTGEGGEIGRAQALQARACGAPLSVDMNPVLLKPESDLGSQVVVQGKRVATVKARDYYAMKPRLLAAVLESFQRLEDTAELILVEGAGSPAEVNLRAGDIANMGFAEAADLPVVLIGDIDRGGVIASVIGTHAVIEPLERQRIQGFIINKFRGDVTLFDPGLAVIEKATGWPSLGVVTHCQAARRLPAEDALGLEQPQDGGAGAVRIALLKFARIANHDDFDPLRLEAEVELILVTAGQAIPGDCDLVILPGSKSTIGDLADLRAQGWDVDLRAHLRRGGQVLGICGGYQMLGAMIHDPDGIEGPAGSVAGLGLLAVETTMTAEKTLTQVTGRLHPGGQEVQGYEMHIGRTEGPDRARAFVRFADHSDGAVSADGKVAGCYLHGLFAADGARKALLAALGARADSGLAFDQAVESALDQVADHLEREINVEEILALARRR